MATGFVPLGVPFPDADTARSRSRNLVVVDGEVAQLQSAVLGAIEAGQMSVDVTSSTMAGSTDYYDVWAGTVTDRVKKDQMDSVIRYFESLGYTILRVTDPSTGNTFLWRISW